MADWLDVIIYFVGSGLAFFAGAGLVLAGLTISPFAHNRPLNLVRNLAVLIGGILVAISAIPLDGWLYAILAIVTVVWLPFEWFANAVGKKALMNARIAVAVAWLLALGLELPFHFSPSLPALDKPLLFVIGDSVSAGMSDLEKETWPKLLAKTHDVDVRDFSKMGATVGSARKQAERIEDGPGLVLLEIGGNDLLGPTTADQFEERLDLLLAKVCRIDRTVVMIELPLPPLANQFGRIQRRLARKYHVALIPRRIFIGVLTTRGATVDGGPSDTNRTHANGRRNLENHRARICGPKRLKPEKATNLHGHISLPMQPKVAFTPYARFNRFGARASSTRS